MRDLDSADSVSVPSSHFLSVKGIKYWTSHGVTGRTKGCIAKHVTAANAQETTVLTLVTKAGSERLSYAHSAGDFVPLFVQVSFHRKTMVSSFCLAFLGDS